MVNKYTNTYSKGELDFDYLIHNFSLPLYLYAKKRMRNNIDAEDIVQDCLVRLWEKQSIIGDIKSVKSYLYRMVHNECQNRLKSKNILEYRERLDDKFSLCDYSEYEDEFDAIELILTSIETLPPQYANIMKLAVKGMKNSEIASNLNIAESSVKVMKTRSLKKIKALFGDEMLILFYIYINNF